MIPILSPRWKGKFDCLKWFLFVFMAFASFEMTAQSQAQGPDPRLAAFVPGKIYVRFKPDFKPVQFPVSVNGTGDEQKRSVSLGKEIASFRISKIEKTYKVLSPRSRNLSDFYTFTFAEDAQKDELIRALAARSEIELAEKIPVMQTFCPPNDPDFAIPARNWHLLAVGAPAIWCDLDGCPGSVIAIVDDAVRTTHEDLASKVVGQHDVTDGTSDANPPGTAMDDYFTHGTHVAGIAAGATNNGLGNASVGYNCTIYAIKTVSDGSLNPAILDMPYEGVEWAIAAGVDIINMSWGGYGGYSATHQALFTEAFNQNIICVAAAGNDNLPFAAYPAAYEHVIGVGASAPGGVRACFSNYGTGVDIAAPGAQIWSSLAGSNSSYGFLSGTSMASPMIAGIAGLIRCADPDINPTQLELCMINTVTPLGNNPGCNPQQSTEGQISVADLADCDYSEYGNCPPEDCELVRNGDFEAYDGDPTTVDDEEDRVDLLCAWKKGNSSPYMCLDGEDSYLALYYFNTDIERIVSENQLALTPGQTYTLEFDYSVTRQSPDQIIVCLTQNNTPGSIANIAHTVIGFINSPAVDHVNQINSECPPAPLTWHRYEGAFTYSGDGRLFLNISGFFNTTGVSESICWFDNISIRPRFDITVTADETFLCEGECTQLHVETDLLNPVIIWDPPTGLSDPTSTDPIACPEETTVYTATIYDPVSMCTDSRSVTITRENPYWELECHDEHNYFCIVNETGGSHVMQWITPFTGSWGHCQSTAGLNYGDPLVFIIYTFGPNGERCADTISTVYTCGECDLNAYAVVTGCDYTWIPPVYYVKLHVNGTNAGCWRAIQRFSDGTEILLGTFFGSQTVGLGPFHPEQGNWALLIVPCELEGCTRKILIQAPDCGRGEGRSVESGHSEFQLYPSPVQSMLIVENLDEQQNEGIEETSFVIFDILGKQLVRTTLPVAGSYRLNVEELTAGVYFLGVIRDGKVEFAGKFVKQ